MKIWTRIHRISLTVWLVILGFPFALAIQYVSWQKTVDNGLNKFVVQSHTIRDRLFERLNGADEAATSLATLVYSSLHVDADQFRIFSEYLLERYPFLLSTSYHPRIGEELRHQFELERRSHGFPLFAINDVKEDSRSPASRRPYYFPLLYHEPFSPENAAAIGDDALTDPVLAPGITTAIDTRFATLQFPPDLRAQPFSWIIKAIYTGKSVPDQIPQRRLAASGIIALRLDITKLIEQPGGQQRFDLVLDSLSSGKWQPIASAADRGESPSLIGRFLLPQFEQIYSIHFLGQEYIITLRRPATWQDFEYTIFIMTMAAGILTLAVLAFAGRLLEKRARDLKTRNAEIARQVADKTTELITANSRLQIEIADRLQAERSLAGSEAKFRGFFEKMRTGAAIYEAESGKGEFICIDINKAAEQIDQLDRPSVRGRRLAEIYPAADESGLLKSLEEVNRTGRAQFLPELRYHDNRLSGWREMSVFKLSTSEIVVLFQDVTDRKRAEERLRQSQKMEAIGTLAGGIAHDFNNILTAILGFSELAKACIKDEAKVLNSLSQVVTASRRARELIRQILTFSRKESRRLEPLLPHLIIKESLKLLRVSLPTTISIEEHIDSDCGMIMGDPVKMQQVLMNICTNALDAMENQEGVITVSLGARQLTAEDLAGEENLQPGTFIELAISDTGHGMDAATMARIFDPYFTTKEMEKGTGLGLSMVHGIIKDHGGLIKVESQPSQGATFRVYFRAAKSRLPLRPPEAETCLIGGTERILFVDDEVPITEMEKDSLELLGYTVTTATNAIEALTRFKAAPMDFDLIITDQSMPVMSGTALAREVLKQRPALPIILCTGFNSLINEDTMRELGIGAFIQKPLDRDEFARLIRAVLDTPS